MKGVNFKVWVLVRLHFRRWWEHRVATHRTSGPTVGLSIIHFQVIGGFLQMWSAKCSSTFGAGGSNELPHTTLQRKYGQI